MRVGLSSTAFSALEPMSSPTMLFFFFPSMLAPDEDGGFQVWDSGGQALDLVPSKTGVQNLVAGAVVNWRTSKEGCENLIRGESEGRGKDGCESDELSSDLIVFADSSLHNQSNIRKTLFQTLTFLPPALEGVNTNFFCDFSAFAITRSGTVGSRRRAVGDRKNSIL